MRRRTGAGGDRARPFPGAGSADDLGRRGRDRRVSPTANALYRLADRALYEAKQRRAQPHLLSQTPRTVDSGDRAAGAAPEARRRRPRRSARSARQRSRSGRAGRRARRRSSWSGATGRSGSRRARGSRRSRRSRSAGARARGRRGCTSATWAPRRAPSRGEPSENPSGRQPPVQQRDRVLGQRDRLGADPRRCPPRSPARRPPARRSAPAPAGCPRASRRSPARARSPGAISNGSSPAQPAPDRLAQARLVLGADVQERRRARAAVEVLVGAADRQVGAGGVERDRDARRRCGRGPTGPAPRRRGPPR